MMELKTLVEDGGGDYGNRGSDSMPIMLLPSCSEYFSGLLLDGSGASQPSETD